MLERFREARHVLLSLERTHRSAHVDPPRGRFPSYALPIPRGWVRALGVADIEPHPLRPEIIGVFLAAPDPLGPRVVITASRLPWEVDPLEWTRWTWTLSGRRVFFARWLDTPREDRFEVGALETLNGRTELRRAVGLLDGGLLLRVEVAVPEERWEQLHDLLWPCGVLFELEHPTRSRSIEALASYTGPITTFELPASWSVTPTWSLPEAEGWMAWIDRSEPGRAALRVDVVRHRAGFPVAPRIRRRLLRADLERAGLDLARITRPLAVTPEVAAIPGFLGMFATEARDGDATLEVRVAHRELRGASVDYVMVGPLTEPRHVDCLRSCRALEVALHTMRPAAPR